MLEVRFYDKIEDSQLDFAVIIARTGEKWVFCKHKERDTYEVPGGHREAGETIEEAANRELKEETGVVDLNMEKSLHAIAEAVEKGAELVLFPEVQLTEFFPQYLGRDVSSYSVSIEDENVKKFCKFVQPLFRTIFINCKENRRLSHLRDTLLPKIMSGEIDVSNLNC